MAKKPAKIARKRSAPDWAPKFLAELSERGNIRDSCRASGISRQGFYNRRNADEAFAAQVALAIEEAADALEREAWRRAVEGCERPVYYLGERCGGIREYSDTLMSLLLKAHKPDRFRERSEVKHSGEVKQKHTYDLSKLTDEQLQQLETLALAARPAVPAP